MIRNRRAMPYSRLILEDTFSRSDSALHNSVAEYGRYIWSAPQYNIVSGLAVPTVVLESTVYTDNPGFDSDTLWTYGAGWAIGSGIASYTAGSFTTIYQTTSTPIAGKFVNVTHEITGGSGQLTLGGVLRDSSLDTTYSNIALSSEIGTSGHPAWGNRTVDNFVVKEITKANACALLQTNESNFVIEVAVSPVNNDIIKHSGGLILNANNITDPTSYIAIVWCSANDNGHWRVIRVKDNVPVSSGKFFGGRINNTPFTLKITKNNSGYQIKHSRVNTPYYYSLDDTTSLIKNNTIHGVMSLTALARFDSFKMLQTNGSF